MSPSAPSPAGATFGVEEEFLLVDAVSGAPFGQNLAVIDAARALGLRLTTEFASCQVETDTSVHTSSAELRTELSELRSLAALAAARLGARLLPVGVPPVGTWGCPTVKPPCR